MKLYPRKLRNIEDLEREKKLLLREQRQLEEEDILSLDGIFGKKGAIEEAKDGGSILNLLNFLPVSNPFVDIVIKAAHGWFSKKSEATPKTARQSASDGERGNEGVNKKKGKTPLRAIAVEVIGGYLKWKAIELSFKGIRHILKTRREHKKGQ